MKADIALIESAGEVFERDFIGASEIIVRREGHSRVRHIFTLNGRRIARLKWRGLRRAIYEADGLKFEINVEALDRRISIISEDGSESFLIRRSRANPNRDRLTVEMAEGDDFYLERSRGGMLRSQSSITVHKKFYQSTLLVFCFDTDRRTQTTVRIEVLPAMKWEARYLHRLIALIACRIILERRHSGAQPVRVKEKRCRFVDDKRDQRRSRF
ncbi:MAG: hypothetical protein AB1631_25715 [Acidobacteriota bacterium]